jgi:hypothetical protein
MSFGTCSFAQMLCIKCSNSASQVGMHALLCWAIMSLLQLADLLLPEPGWFTGKLHIYASYLVKSYQEPVDGVV